jgi:hypothetical protein
LREGFTEAFWGVLVFIIFILVGKAGSICSDSPSGKGKARDQAGGILLTGHGVEVYWWKWITEKCMERRRPDIGFSIDFRP